MSRLADALAAPTTRRRLGTHPPAATRPRTMEVHVEDVLRNIRNPKVNLRYVLAELM